MSNIKERKVELENTIMNVYDLMKMGEQDKAEDMLGRENDRIDEEYEQGGSIEMGTTDDFALHLDNRIENAKHQLKNRIELVRRRLDETEQKLEGNGNLINPIGELQGQGVHIDLLCREYAIYRRIREEYKATKGESE